MWENLIMQIMVGRETPTRQVSTAGWLLSAFAIPPLGKPAEGCAGSGWDGLGAPKDCFGLSPASPTEPLDGCPC